MLSHRRATRAAIEQRMEWSRFVHHVGQTEGLMNPEVIDRRVELSDKYAMVRSFAPDLRPQ